MTTREERIKEIFSKHTNVPLEEIEYHNRPKRELEHTYYLGENGKQKLLELATKPLFQTAYLDYLCELNNNISFWNDTRPDELRSQDVMRINNNLLPLWTYGQDGYAQIRLSLAHSTVDLFYRIAINKCIGRQSYVANYNIGPDRNLSYEGIRSVSLINLTSQGKYVLVTAALKAFLSGFLTPTHMPIMTDSVLTKISPHKIRRRANKGAAP